MMAYNGGHLYYESVGSGEPIVFVHGFTLDHTMWQPQVDFFSQQYQVVAYDARGFGRSSLPNGVYSHADDLYALHRRLGLTRAHLVGLSMGGRIAANFTLDHPEMVTTLTLIDSALDGCPSDIDWDVHAKAQGLERAKEHWLNHEIFAAARRQAAVVTALRTIIGNYSGWHWLQHDPLSSADIPARARLHQITQPTMVMVGEADVPYFHTVADVLATGISGSRKAVVPHVGHMASMEAPDGVNQLLLDFIANPSCS